jgi:hypothetical protein
MGEEPNIPSTPLFPFIVDFGESEKFGPPTQSALFSNSFDVSSEKGSHLEQNLLIFLVGLCLDLFSELDDGLELGVVLLSLLCV